MACPRLRLTTALLALLLFWSCTSTGNPDHPIKFYGWRFYLYGHEKFTPAERAFSRCYYRNRLPDGSRSGFSRLCRVKAAEQGVPMGINAAMFASACKMNLCYGATAGVE
jgi:hypothetical protein